MGGSRGFLEIPGMDLPFVLVPHQLQALGISPASKGLQSSMY